MRPQAAKASTILELLISLIVLSILVVIFVAIDLFSHSHVLTVDRRSKVQNDLAYIMEHSTKQIGKSIGNAKINKISADGDDLVKVSTIFMGDDTAKIAFYIDVDADGSRDDDAAIPWRGYRLRSVNSADSAQLWWCPNCTDGSSCNTCNPAWGTAENILSKKITSATYTYNAANNYVDMTVEGCWDPASNVTTTDACGSTDRNPNATLTGRIKMPSVSTQ